MVQQYPHSHSEKRSRLQRRFQSLYHPRQAGSKSRRTSGRYAVLRRCNMKSIIEELYYVNIDAKEDIVLPEKKRKKELALYDKLKATLSKESDELFEKFIEITEDHYDELMRMIFKRGVSTGIMIASEAFIEGEKLCD